MGRGGYLFSSPSSSIFREIVDVLFIFLEIVICGCTSTLNPAYKKVKEGNTDLLPLMRNKSTPQNTSSGSRSSIRKTVIFFLLRFFVSSTTISPVLSLSLSIPIPILRLSISIPRLGLRLSISISFTHPRSNPRSLPRLFIQINISPFSFIPSRYPWIWEVFPGRTPVTTTTTVTSTTLAGIRFFVPPTAEFLFDGFFGDFGDEVHFLSGFVLVRWDWLEGGID